MKKGVSFTRLAKGTSQCAFLHLFYITGIMHVLICMFSDNEFHFTRTPLQHHITFTFGVTSEMSRPIELLFLRRSNFSARFDSSILPNCCYQ
jgi:hypothetical protein